MTGIPAVLILLVCVIIFIYLCYQGFPPTVMAPIMAMVVLLTAGMDVYDGMTGAYMTGATNFIKNYFLMFLTGAVFANLMAASGAARSIGLALAKLAKKFPGHETYAALWCCVLVGVVITYGGVMIFVAFFTIIAIVKEMYEELNVPWKMYTVGAFGTAALSMTMIPGSPSANNAVAAGWLGTNAMSGPVLGLFAVVLSILFGHVYFTIQVRKIKASGEGFLPTGKGISEVQFENPEPMNLLAALLPSIVLLVVLNVLDMGVTIACFVGIVVALVDFGLVQKRFRLKEAIALMGTGTSQAINSGFVTAMVIGFGSCVATTAGYAWIIEKLFNLPGPAEYQIVIAVAIAAAMSGSPSGGLNIALENLGQHFLELGINPGVIHRISVVASGSLDSLPSCATLINEFNQARLTQKEAYFNMLWLNTVWPLVLCFILAFLSSTFGIC